MVGLIGRSGINFLRKVFQLSTKQKNQKKSKKAKSTLKSSVFLKIKEKIKDKTVISVLSLGAIFILFLSFVYWDGWRVLTYLSTQNLVLLTAFCFFCFALGHVFLNPDFQLKKPLSRSGFRWLFALLVFFWILFFFLTTGQLEILKLTVIQFIIHILKIILLFIMFLFLVYPRRMRSISKLSFRIFRNHIRLKWWIFKRTLGSLPIEEENPKKLSKKALKGSSPKEDQQSLSEDSDLSLSYMALSTVCLLSLIVVRGVLQERGVFYDFMIISFALFLILFRICIQRLKSLNQSVWWSLWLWIPFGNLYFIYKLLFLEREDCLTSKKHIPPVVKSPIKK